MCELTLDAAKLRVYAVTVRAETVTGLVHRETFTAVRENSAAAFHAGVKSVEHLGEIRAIRITTLFLRA